MGNAVIRPSVHSIPVMEQAGTTDLPKEGGSVRVGAEGAREVMIPVPVPVPVPMGCTDPAAV